MARTLISFLHGFMGDPSDWDWAKTALSDYEVATPLIKPAAGWDAGVNQLGDELPDQSVLVGYSMGARLALALALTRPACCRGLVFVSGNPGIEDEQARRRRRRADEQIARRIESEPRDEFLHYWYTESTVFKSLTDRVLHDEIERKSRRVGDDWASILRTYSVSEQPNFWPRLGELSVPVMAIAGMSDRKYANMIVRMGEEPRIDARIVAQCGHIVHREQPHVFHQLLKDFLNHI